MAYRFVESEKTVFPVVVMCLTLGVSASGYYEWVGRPSSRRQLEDERLIALLRVQHIEHKSRYGSRRHQKTLASPVGRNRVRRLMKSANLIAKQPKRFVTTTKSNDAHPVAPNLLDRQFNPSAPNMSWVGDITYVPTAEGFLYLATVIELFSRRILGWSISERITKQLTLNAFEMAVARRQCAPQCFFLSLIHI